MELSFVTTAKTKCPTERSLWAPVVPEDRRVVLLENGCLYPGVTSRLCDSKSVGKQYAKRCERQMWRAALLCLAAQLRDPH